jgi:hypothetical protein
MELTQMIASCLVSNSLSFGFKPGYVLPEDSTLVAKHVEDTSLILIYRV